MRPILRAVAAGALAVTVAVTANTAAGAQATEDTEPAAEATDAPSAAEATESTEATARQFTLFDASLTHLTDKYWAPNFARTPYNWVRPVNYANGRAYLRLQVTSKPSSILMWGQVCMWRNRYTQETCARAVPFTDEGTYWVDLGVVSQWWKKGGSYPFTSPPDVVRILLKDPVTKKLFNSRHCTPVCYPRGDLAQHIPVSMKGTLIIVAQGQRLNPPAAWAGCPSTWSTECPRPT